MSNFFNSISPDAWIQTSGAVLGAFIGTFLAGHFAIKASKREKQEDITKRYLNGLGSLNYLIMHFEGYFNGTEPSKISNRIKTSEIKRSDFISEINKSVIPLNIRKYFAEIDVSLSQLFHYQVINEVIHKMEANTDPNVKEMKKFFDSLVANKKIIEKKLKVDKYI